MQETEDLLNIFLLYLMEGGTTLLFSNGNVWAVQGCNWVGVAMYRTDSEYLLFVILCPLVEGIECECLEGVK